MAISFIEVSKYNSLVKVLKKRKKNVIVRNSSEKSHLLEILD